MPGEDWWALEHEQLDGIAFGILYHHTADRELAEARSKAFALEVLGPLAKPTLVVESAIDAWLMAPASRPAPVWRISGALSIQCARCPTLLPVAVRHFEVLSVFGTLCDRCRGVIA